MDRSIDLLKRLISINSENPDRYETEIVEYISSVLTKKDIKHRIIKSSDKRYNLLGELEGSGTGTLILNGHLDTKPAGEGWDTNPFKPVIKKDRLYGLGASDMKGGIAAILSAVLDIADGKISPKNNLQFQFVADEEMNSKFGTKFLVDKGYIKMKNRCFAVVAEPTEMKLITKSLGNLWLTIKIYGIKTHAGVYWNGINAIQVSQDISEKLRRFAYSKRGSNSGEGSRFPNVNVGYIHGGSHPGSVPDYCELALDFRTKDENQRAKLGYKYKIEEFGGGGLPAWDIKQFQEREILRYLMNIEKIYSRVTNRRIKKGSFFGGSDAGVLSSVAKIPTVILGPGSLKQAHKPNEWTDMKSVIASSEIYKKMALG
jgi:acetylornithine deacetylase/succinyl-diaminopimelate desuccinylase family protein